VNPCALAGLAFLVSYLLYLRRSPAVVLIVGTLFACGAVAAYFAAGLGLYFVLVGSGAIPGVRLAVHSGAAALTLALSIVAWSMAAARDAQHGVRADTRRAEHALVRRLGRGPVVWVGAPLCGAAFALLELACTGQVYLPAIALMASSGEFARGVRWLVLYNTAFAIPALALTTALAWGGRALSVQRFRPVGAGGRFAVAVALTVLATFLLLEVRHAASVV